MRALVTGAAGFIGSRLVELLVESGWSVRGVDAVTTYYDVRIKRRHLELLERQPNVELVESDLRTADLDELVETVDAVFHFAAQPGVRASWATFSEYVDHNVLATQRLLDAVREHSITRFVFASSSSVYGQVEGAVDEDAPARPYSPYGVTKLAAEALCGAYAENFAVPVTSLRLFTVYGPRQRPDMAIHRLIRASLLGEEFEVFGDGSQVRAFTYVDDVVDAAIAAARAPTEPGTVLNISGGSTCTLTEVIAAVEEATGRPVPIVHRDARAGDVTRTDADITRANALLGWEPVTQMTDGIARQVEDLRVHLEADNDSR